MSKFSYGWKAQAPDFRDYPYVPKSIPPATQSSRVKLPEPVWNQLNIGSCTAHGTCKGALHALVQEGAAAFEPSRLFQYYNARIFEDTVTIDSGASIRNAIKAIRQYGMAPAEMWPYDVTQFTVQPPQAAYSAALADVVVEYYAVAQQLDDMRACLAEGYPIVIGFSVYDSFESGDVAATGIVPLPANTEKLLGGHCVIVDEDDATNRRFGFTNSWGSWGANGRGYFPYEYLTNPDLATDFWTIRQITHAPPNVQ